MSSKKEILLPVGSKDMLIAAVRSGADAVYLGAKDFSARRNAENFDITELKEAVKYCHIRGVRCYLTLNILIKESELRSAFNLARDAYNLGIDGIIIEDLGLAKILNEKIPDLSLHASTQMSVHSAASLPILKEMGFKRVVVAREMSKTDLSELCKRAKALDMEIEVFVHGALCMCMSGQCQLSAFLGSRSGNRGLCAGPCRLPFKAENGTGYDLSLKDLSLLDYLGELSKMGVSSFKIEGRMKRPEYVAAAGAAARQSLDKGYVDAELNNTLRDVFSRSGFTDGYFTDNLGKEMFGIRTKDDVLSANKAFPKLHEIYRNERKSVGVSVKCIVKENKPLSLTLCDGENTVTAKGDIPQKAQNRAVTPQDVLKNITKFGNTPYYENANEIIVDNGLFVSAGALNELRRKAVEKLDKKRSEIKREKSNAVFENNDFKASEKTPKLVCRFSNETQIPVNLKDIEAVIYPLECNPEKVPQHKNVIIDIPRGIKAEKLISERLRCFREKGIKNALCGNLSAVEIAKKEDFNIVADTGLNCFNSLSAKALEKLGAKAVTVSYEMALEDDFESPIQKGIIAYGNVPLMLFKNCPIKNGKACKDCDKKGVLTDRMGTEFPIRCRMGYSEMLNCVPIWMADRQKELKNFDFLTLYFTDETAERVEEVISAFGQASPPDTKHTRGLYYRGTI